MNYFDISKICLGTWQFSGKEDMMWGSSFDESNADKIIKKSIELGINCFDTAEAYGLNNYSEKVLGSSLNKYAKREDVFICSKFGKHDGSKSIKYDKNMLAESLTRSLEALQTNYIDLYQIHWSVNVSNIEEMEKELNSYIQQGKIKNKGVCNYGVKSLSECNGLISNQLPYNLLWRPIEYDIIPYCKKNNIDIFAYSSLQQGILTGKFCNPEFNIDIIPESRLRTRHFHYSRTQYSRHNTNGVEDILANTMNKLITLPENLTQISLQWLLNNGVKSVIVGANSVDQISELVSYVNNPIDINILNKATEYTNDLKYSLGSNPDMWSQETRYN
jgi:myo-inositol catabolism protein IolS